MALVLMCFLVLAIDLQAKANDTAPTSKRTVLLLSHNVHNLSSAVLDDRIVKWEPGTIGYQVIATIPTTNVQAAVQEVQDFFETSGLTEKLHPDNAAQDVPIRIFYLEKPSLIFSKYQFDFRQFASEAGFEQPLDDQTADAMKNGLSDDEQVCRIAKLTGSDFIVRGAVIFVSTRLEPRVVKYCVQSSLLSALGLYTKAEPDIRQSPESLALMDANVTALRILYHPGVNAGDTIGQALEVSNAIYFQPSD